MNKKNNKKFYVTTPLYYVNAKPHVGTLYSTLIADVVSRWNKICGKDVFFLTGTDEHGQKIAEVAKNAGVKPKDFVDSMVPFFENVWKKYEIEYDKFIRTTDADHEKSVLMLLEKLEENGDIYKSFYTGLYCIPCERYVTSSESIEDEKGKFLCPECKRALKEIDEESYFFRLSAYEDRLLKFYEENSDFIFPKERLHEVISFVKSGLRDLSISRKKVKWGITFPIDPNHTVYVWADALTSYISAVGFGKKDKKFTEDFEYWWPADIHVIGKDILRFHAVYWPAFLMAADLPLPKKLLSHGYILTDGKKMSKSLANVMDPLNLAKWYGVEPVRYFLLRHMSISEDSHFSLEELENHITSDLANNLGNLLNRTLTLAINNGFEKIEPIESLETDTAFLKEKCEESFRSFWDGMNHNRYNVAISDVWKFISELNAFFHSQEPWKLVKENKEYFQEVISSICHSLYAVGIMIWPVMPKKMEELLQCLGHKFDLKNDYEKELRENKWNKTFILKKSKESLFSRPESHLKELNGEEEKADVKYISIDDFAKVHLNVGTIIECDSVEGSEKLYKLKVDLGKIGKRQVLAGVAKDFLPKDLIGKQGIYVTNLKPRKIMGQESQGMMLFAKDKKGNMRFVTVSEKIENGTRLS
ncbi:methionine--tRNA ligase [Candidatus Babeliales bacterium]|nr:methionine--tRNA ligase [Candidatus Babeliales bacterium]